MISTSISASRTTRPYKFMPWWLWVIMAVIVYGVYVALRFFPEGENIELTCGEYAPRRFPAVERADPDWRWFPPEWWCNYRWDDGFTSSHSLSELYSTGIGKLKLDN